MWADPESVELRQALEDKFFEALQYSKRLLDDGYISEQSYYYHLVIFDLLTRSFVDEKITECIDQESSILNYLLNSNFPNGEEPLNLKNKVSFFVQDEERNVLYINFCQLSKTLVIISIPNNYTKLGTNRKIKKIKKEEVSYKDFLKLIDLFKSKGFSRVDL